MTTSFVVQQSVKTPSGTLTASVTETASSFTEINETIPDATTDLPVHVAIDVSALKTLFIHSDQNLTLETNSASSPADTIALIAGVPHVWTPKLGGSSGLTADVTTIFITNASGEDAQLRMRVLQDPTP